MSDTVHGGALTEMMTRFPNAPQPWLDLSTGINPIAYPVPQLSTELWQRLPEAEHFSAAAQAAAAFMGCAPTAITFTSGSQSAISLLPDLLPARRVALLEVTYSEYASAWARTDCEILRLPDPKALMHCEADVICLCNPNNPDGYRWPRADLDALVARQTERGGWVVVDEAYADFLPSLSLAGQIDETHRLVVLRSFGKTFGLAGLRLGALLGPQSLLHHLRQRMGPWPVSTVALEIARQAYRNTAWQHAAAARAYAGCEALRSLLTERELQVEGDGVLYLSVLTPQAQNLWENLARQGVYVRRFADNAARLRFGLLADHHEFTRLRTALWSALSAIGTRNLLPSN